MFTDAAALAISLAAIRIGRRPADKTRTFGYYRFEILAAAFNAVVLFLVAIYILYEAYQRLRNPEAPIASGGMLVVASIGLVVNIIAIRLLKSGSADSLNVKSAYLEVWSDLLGSVAVIAAALIIQFTGWQPIDPILAVLIGLWILPRTWTLLKQSLNILLEGVPEGIGLAEIDAALLSVTGVSSVHDLHVWAITSGKISLTAHLVPTRGNPILGKVKGNDNKGNPSTTYSKDMLGLPYTTIGYANGPGYTGASDKQPEGAKTYPHLPSSYSGITRGRPDLNAIDTTQPSYLQEATVPLSSETHAGEDVAIYAGGPGAQWFHGVQEQNYIYHVMAEALKLKEKNARRGRDDNDD